MDARLWSIGGKRAETLKQPDLPNLARAIVAYERRLPGITLHAGSIRNITYVMFQANKGAFQVLVRGDDWAKIVPYLKSNFLSPAIEPLLPWGFGVASVANIDVFDSQYYNKVLGVLNALFPITFPTSYL